MPSAPAVVTLASSPVTYSFTRTPAVKIRGDASSGWSGSIGFKVSAADALAFARFCAGTPQTYTVGGVTVTRIIPLSHPADPKLLAQGIEIDYFGQWTPGNADWFRQWSDAKVVVEFRSVPYATDGSAPFLTVETRTGSEAITLAGVKMAFASGTPLQADAARSIPVVMYMATIYQAPTLGDDAFMPLVGKLNNATITLGDYVCPVGTARLEAPTTRMTMTSNFVKSYERTLPFSVRPVHWNAFLRPDNVFEVPTDPGGNPVYELADFSPLFQ